MFKKKIFSFLLILFLISTYIQAQFTISGYIRDSNTGEEQIGASVSVEEMKGTGTVTNAYGFYSLTLPKGNYTLKAQFIGYEAITQSVVLNQNTKIDFRLNQKLHEINEVVINAERNNENVTRTLAGVDKMEIQKINNIPVLFGEKDVLKTIQLLPGVKSAGEGNSGFYVRGGAADQNLILLDEATVYNASHLLGFFSVFNSNAIKDVTIYKGGMPSEYGGRLSSVLDIKMNDGNNQKFGVDGGIGLISSRLTLEGPIVKDKGSFTISGRRTYADVFLRLSNDTTINKAILYFYDLNAKANYKINDKNRVFLSGYFGRDVLGFGSNFGFDWGNATGTLRWTHLFSDRLFSNTSLIFSNYLYNITLDAGGISASIMSKIQDYNFKQDFQFYPSVRSTIKFGYNSTYHTIVPGSITATIISSINSFNLPKKYAWENAFYAGQEFKLTDQINMNYGLRLSAFSLLGPGNFNKYNALGETIDTIAYTSRNFVKTFVNLEPRLILNYIINQQNSIKSSYARNSQNLHLLSNTTSGSPTDMWIPSSNNTKPEVSDQVSLGYFKNFNDNSYEFSIETYYKIMQNQIDYKNGAQLTFNENVESQLLYGRGRAYGVEFFIKKKYGRLNGWISYTLSRTERKFDEINEGTYFPAKQDRTHDFAIVGIYELNKKWTLSGTWVYYTGNAVTFPSGKYKVAGRVTQLYTSRNAYRMPAYHRMDIGATWITKKTEKFESSWNFSIYNVYARENAYTITFRQSETNPDKTEAVQTTLFRIIPSFTYNFKF